ncbi:MAG: hypothetical protein OXH94_10595 [Rhodospirillales bacterium]|nr:hypothetical protein [Rhodospirillales bacterium]
MPGDRPGDWRRLGELHRRYDGPVPVAERRLALYGRRDGEISRRRFARSRIGFCVEVLRPALRAGYADRRRLAERRLLGHFADLSAYIRLTSAG